MPAYPDEKSRVITETDYTIDKLTNEYAISPVYSCLEMSHYCLTQVAIMYKKNEVEIPKELEVFLTKTYKQLVEDQKSLIQEQTLMLNTSGSA